MISESLQHAFERMLAQAPRSEPAERARRDALERFAATGLPSTRLENWRYTDLKPIRDRTFDFAPALPDSSAVAAARALLGTAGVATTGHSVVFVDGHHVPDLSAATNTLGFELSTLGEATHELATPSARRTGLGEHPLAMLNSALARDGTCIRVAEGVRVDEPVHLVFVGSGAADVALQPRVIVALEAGAELTIVQHFIDCAPAASWTNLVTEIVQAEGSRMTLYRLQEHTAAQFHTALLRAELGADAVLACGYVDLGGRLVRNDIDVELSAPGARAELFGVFLAAAGQHLDNHLRVDHLAPRTYSDETFRGIIGDRGRGVFNGKVVVHRDAQQVDARQRSDNLLLSERAEIDTKPELEIYADNVKCSHGATVGELDSEQLFYLRSRGVDEEAARGLLTFAFANTVLARIALPALREHIAERVARRLPHHERWEKLV